MRRLNRNELIRIFAEVLEVDPGVLSEDSSPENLQRWDSGRSMEIVILIEEELDVELTASEIGEMISIGATKEILIRRGLMSNDNEGNHEFTAS